MVAFALHIHESAMGVHVFLHPEPPSNLPLHPIPLGCPRVPAMSALFHAYKENQTCFKVFFFFKSARATCPAVKVIMSVMCL